jgi:SAM-dependent methyltransferase
MGTAREQGALWGARAADWAAVNEPAWSDIFATVMERTGVASGTRLLDVGCGAGGALTVARERGAVVAGLDASAPLVGIARGRLPGARIEVGEMEELPFAAGCFDVVTAINAFQFAGNIVKAIAEARRVTREGGTIAMMTWGRRDDCDLLRLVMPMVSALLPPPSAAAAPPLPLAEPGIIEGLMQQAGLRVRESAEFPGALVFPSLDAGVRAIMSAAARSIAHSGEEAVRRAITEALRPLRLADATVRLDNRFRLVLAGP